MFTPEILQAAETRLQNAMHLTPVQLKRAHDLIVADAVKPFKSSRFPDSFQVHSQSRERTYSPNLSTLDCQCEHGLREREQPEELRKPCAHILAAFLYRHCVAEQERRQRELEQLDWRIAFEAMAQRAGLEIKA